MTTALRILGCVALFLGMLNAQANEADKTAVTDALTGLRTALKDKLDDEVQRCIKIVAEKWESADALQRKDVHGLLPRCLGMKDSKTRTVVLESAAKLGGGEKDKDAETTAKILADEAVKKTTQEDLTYHGQVLVSLGKLRSVKQLSVITKHLGYKDWDVRAAAAESLAAYKDSTLAARKESVDAILKIYNSAWSAANDPRDTTAKNNLNKINRAMESTLKLLTNVKTGVEGAPGWQKWWNDTGKKATAW